MPRNKTAKRTKRQTTSASAVVQKMEKDFLTAPVKLASYANKEVTALKQRETKLKHALDKINNQAKSAENRIESARAKTSPAAKKQLTAAKKNHGKIIKTQTDLNKQLASISKALAAATSKHSKLVALRKHLAQFEKDWSKNVKQIAAANKAQKKTPTSPSVTPLTESPQTIENIFDTIRQDEPETTS